ncbi:MAG: acylglycerol kinase family protein [Pontixanthobacter sp.]
MSAPNPAPNTAPEPAPTPSNARAKAPVIGVIYNPRSHRNRGQDLDVANRANVFVEQPDGKEDIAAALERLHARNIDYLIVNGGDGTVRDVLTQGQHVFRDAWPELAVLPKGKTNALNVDLGAPADWTLTQAVDAWPHARRLPRRPIAVEDMSGDDPGRRLGFIMGGGAFTLGVRAGQDAHRMGAFNSLAVGVTTAWGVTSILMGRARNKWRRGTPMRFTIGPKKRELPHCDGPQAQRRCLFLASTLERFPADMKLFGPGGTVRNRGLKLLVLDRPKRRIFAMVPALLAGFVPAWAKRGGFRQLAAEEFTLQIGDEYILDGEAYPAGTYRVSQGPRLVFLVP